VVSNDRELLISDEERTRALTDAIFADQLFDSLLPVRYRCVSNTQWTSAQVAEQIALLLESIKPTEEAGADLVATPASPLTFIDIGSGVGKLCILLALRMSRSNLKFFGIEQRKNLVKISEKIRAANNLDNVHFAHRNMMELAWEKFDIYYLYNPFQEHVVEAGGSQIDHEIDFDRSFYTHYITEVYRQLSWADKGKRLITFHGYGEMVPDSWTLRASQIIEKGSLCLWEKTK
jgi:SAM-dependent methyltransferase